MNIKGFTLVELLSVIVILSLIVLITTISVGTILNDSSKSLSKRQKSNIENAAKAYYIKEGMDLNDTCVDVSELIGKGYIEAKQVLDPSDKKKMTGSVRIMYASNQYSYKYQQSSCE